MSPFQLESVEDGPTKLPWKFGQNWVRNSSDIKLAKKIVTDNRTSSQPHVILSISIKTFFYWRFQKNLLEFSIKSPYPLSQHP